jgi:hypothetical protein
MDHVDFLYIFSNGNSDSWGVLTRCRGPFNALLIDIVIPIRNTHKRMDRFVSKIRRSAGNYFKRQADFLQMEKIFTICVSIFNLRGTELCTSRE